MPYPPTLNYPDATTYNDNIKSRKMSLQLENVNAYQIRDIYDATAGGSPALYSGFDPNTYVLCDSYNRVTNKTTGKKIGMPILYYKADPARLGHPAPTDAVADMRTRNALGQYIYNYLDNQVLIDMAMPWLSVAYVHPLASAGGTPEGVSIAGATGCPKKFYDVTRDPKVTTGDRPVRADSYILMSAGFDGEYGTKDDITNFGD
jgi:hypothetical protein